jgi:hypothetical protein
MIRAFVMATSCAAAGLERINAETDRQADKKEVLIAAGWYHGVQWVIA